MKYMNKRNLKKIKMMFITTNSCFSIWMTNSGCLEAEFGHHWWLDDCYLEQCTKGEVSRDEVKSTWKGGGIEDLQEEDECDLCGWQHTKGEAVYNNSCRGNYWNALEVQVEHSTDPGMGCIWKEYGKFNSHMSPAWQVTWVEKLTCL